MLNKQWVILCNEFPTVHCLCTELSDAKIIEPLGRNVIVYFLGINSTDKGDEKRSENSGSWFSIASCFFSSIQFRTLKRRLSISVKNMEEMVIWIYLGAFGIPFAAFLLAFTIWIYCKCSEEVRLLKFYQLLRRYWPRFFLCN